jgi:hypothetical protein
MGPLSTDDFLREAGDELREYDQHVDQFRDLDADNAAKQDDLKQQFDQALVQFSDALLPDLGRVRFQSLADTLGMPELVRLFDDMQRQHSALGERIAALEQSDLYREREDRQYRLEAQLAEVEPSYQHASQDLDQMRGIPRLRDLVARGYGTTHYPHRGWLRYFKREFLEDWKRADEACEKLGVSAFGEVLSRYREREEQVEVLGRSVRELRDGLAQIESVVNERARLLQESLGLPDVVRRNTARQIVPLLIKNERLTAGLPNPETVRSRCLAIDGMEHQIRYLEELRLKMQQDVSQLLERRDKLRAEAHRYEGDRYRYRNKRFTEEQFRKRFGRTARYGNLYGRYDRANQTVYVFHDYDRASPLDDFLWWDLMTDGRLDGNFIPEVSEYYAERPGYQYERPSFDSGVGAPGFDVDGS